MSSALKDSRGSTLHGVLAGNAHVTNAGLFMLGCFLLALSHHLPREFDHFVFGYAETTTWALSAYLGACVLVLTQPVNRLTLPMVLVFAVLCRLVLLTPEPYLSSDIYRYVWDGIVQNHGVNPYRYVPGDAHLSFLRDDDIFPNINRRDYARTIYPPVAQMMFAVAAWISPTLTGMKLLMGAAEAVTALCLCRMLQLLGQPRERVLLCAWSPLLIWEIGSSGHVDALIMAALSLALLFRLRDRPVLTGLALGAAVMIKFYPLLLLPALFRRGQWRMPAALAAVVAVGYALYSGAGRYVFGFAGGYAAEEGLSSGSRYFLLELARHLPGLGNLPVAVYLAFCGLVFAPLLGWSWRCAARPGAAFLRPAVALAFALMLLFSPHYPWYVAWLVPLLTLLPSLPLAVYIYAVYVGFTTALAEPGPKMFLLNKWIYGSTAVAFAIGFAARQISARQRLPEA